MRDVKMNPCNPSVCEETGFYQQRNHQTSIKRFYIMHTILDKAKTEPIFKLKIFFQENGIKGLIKSYLKFRIELTTFFPL